MEIIRTYEERNEEVKLLRALRTQITQYNAFGGDRWAAIDAQIVIISPPEEPEDELDESAIEDEFGEEENIMEAAHEAMRWLEGEEGEDGPPSKGWAELVGVVPVTLGSPAEEFAKLRAAGETGDAERSDAADNESGEQPQP